MRACALSAADLSASPMTGYTPSSTFSRTVRPLEVMAKADAPPKNTWLTGAAISQWCTDGEMAYGFVNWLFSEDVGAILRQNHIYLSYASSSAPKTLDAKGEELVLFPVRKEYTAQGRRDLQDWWIKSVRFGKEK